MSIYGYRATSTGPYGAPSYPRGLLAGRLMNNLEFTLRVAGPSTSEFHTAQSFQSCQDSNDDIMLTVTATDEGGLAVDLHSATDLIIAIMKPDGTMEEHDAVISTNGMDGRISYTLLAADLDQDGLYRLQAKFKIAGALKTSRWGGFTVGPNIVEPVGP